MSRRRVALDRRKQRLGWCWRREHCPSQKMHTGGVIDPSTNQSRPPPNGRSRTQTVITDTKYAHANERDIRRETGKNVVYRLTTRNGTTNLERWVVDRDVLVVAGRGER